MMEQEIRPEQGTPIDSAGYNQGTMARQLIHEQINSAQNYDTIYKAYVHGKAMDISDCEKAPMINGEKLPCVIVGSGPSLNHSIELLREWKGGILCTTSHALSLIRYGIQPTHIVALDPFCTYDEIAGVDWSKTRTKLITHPGVWPSLIKNWPNELILYAENMGQKNSFYDTTQKAMYSVRESVDGKTIRDPLFRYMVRTSFALFACSPPLQLFAADKLGYGTAFLCGCDFSYPDNRDRFDNWTLKDIKKMPVEEPWDKYVDTPSVYVDEVDPTLYGTEHWDDLWEKHENILQPIPKERWPMMTANGIPSERIHLYYKKNFMSAWRLSGKTIYTTDHGAITEIPFADIKKVVKKQGLGFQQQKDWFIREVTDKYLHSVGCYVVESDAGKSFLESQKPEIEVRNFAVNLYQQYFCPACKNTFKIVDVPPAYEPMKATLNNLIEMNKTDPTKYSETIVNLSKALKDIEPAPNNLIDHEGQECPGCKKGILKHAVNINLDENFKRIDDLINK